MRARIVSVFAVAVAVASCVAVSFYRDADAQAAAILLPVGLSLPHPSGIVNIDGGVVYAQTQGLDQTVFTVPAGKWLAITDVRTYAESTLRVVQRFSGADVNKLSNPWTSAAGPDSYQGERQSLIGYAFPAGSTVVMKVDPDPTGDNAPISKCRWNLVGYLAN